MADHPEAPGPEQGQPTDLSASSTDYEALLHDAQSGVPAPPGPPTTLSDRLEAFRRNSAAQSSESLPDIEPSDASPVDVPSPTSVPTPHREPSRGQRLRERLRRTNRTTEQPLNAPEAADILRDHPNVVLDSRAAEREARAEATARQEAADAAAQHRTERVARAQAKLEAAAAGREHADTPRSPLKVGPDGTAQPMTLQEQEAAAKEAQFTFEPGRAEHQAYAEKAARESILRPLPRAKPADSDIRPGVGPHGRGEANYETDIDSAMDEAFRTDRAAAEMNALAAEYRLQHEVLTRETNTSLTHDRMVNGELQKGSLTLLEESYKEAIKEVRNRYQKHKVEADTVVKKLVEARANHQDMETSILSNRRGDSQGQAWVLRHELGIPDGAKPKSVYGRTRAYGGPFHGRLDRGARMIQRVYEVPGGGYLVEAVKASTGEFVRSTVINSAREPMRFGRFRMPFTGTELEARLKKLRRDDLHREPPKNIGEYFGVRIGPKLPDRTGRFAYDISGTAAWDSQLGGPRYNAPRRKPWYLSAWFLRPR